MLHFWLSRGRGSFNLVDTPGTSLYALLNTEVAYTTHIDRDNGWKAVASPVDAKSAYFTVLRSTSCIQSAVAKLEAYSRGADLVSWLHGMLCLCVLLPHPELHCSCVDAKGTQESGGIMRVCSWRRYRSIVV
jgi:hypothetical protein